MAQLLFSWIGKRLLYGSLLLTKQNETKPSFEWPASVFQMDLAEILAICLFSQTFLQQMHTG